MTNNDVIAREPGTTRKPVLSDAPEAVAARLRESPGTWFMIAHGDKRRLAVISQTGYRIRNGLIAAFKIEEGQSGRFDVQVSTDSGVPDRKADVELYARWLTEG